MSYTYLSLVSPNWNHDNYILISKKTDIQTLTSLVKKSNGINEGYLHKNDKNIKLTEREVEIILFLNKRDNPQKVNVLQNEVWGYSSELETHTVETHIYRLRRKIFDSFKDDNFISFFIGSGIMRIIFFQLLKCNVLLLTLTDLDNFLTSRGNDKFSWTVICGNNA